MPYQVTSSRTKPISAPKFYQFSQEVVDELRKLDDEYTISVTSNITTTEQSFQRVFVDEATYRQFQAAIAAHTLIQEEVAARAVYETKTNIVSSILEETV